MSSLRSMTSFGTCTVFLIDDFLKFRITYHFRLLHIFANLEVCGIIFIDKHHKKPEAVIFVGSVLNSDFGGNEISIDRGVENTVVTM